MDAIQTFHNCGSIIDAITINTIYKYYINTNIAL